MTAFQLRRRLAAELDKFDVRFQRLEARRYYREAPESIRARITDARHLLCIAFRELGARARQRK